MHELDLSFTLITARDLRIKRFYDTPARSDGFRLLVDRLWPRGISKRWAKFSEWMPEIAPSADLRNWFGHDPQRWNDFRQRYRAELAPKPSLISSVRDRSLDRRITLLYGARDPAHNHALVLKQFIEAA
jgi:uncharacterized protein YeaO (DUF488 family)